MLAARCERLAAVCADNFADAVDRLGDFRPARLTLVDLAAPREMPFVSVTAAKASFEELLARAEAGEEAIITRWGKPVARLLATAPPNDSARTTPGPTCSSSRAASAANSAYVADWCCG